MSNLVPAIIIALILILTSPASAIAPVIVPEVVQEHQETEPPEPEPVVFESTAYTWTGCRTASGSWPSRGTVAVDPRVIPLGTELHIEGYGSAVAADTGGAIQGQKIDLYMDSEHECLQWGRRKVEVQIRR
jgi:3D (Asp-Asp-Asp) domain-containing protein